MSTTVEHLDFPEIMACGIYVGKGERFFLTPKEKFHPILQKYLQKKCQSFLERLTKCAVNGVPKGNLECSSGGTIGYAIGDQGLALKVELSYNVEHLDKEVISNVQELNLYTKGKTTFWVQKEVAVLLQPITPAILWTSVARAFASIG